MNYAMIRYLIGWMLGVESVFLLLPALTAIVYQEPVVAAYLGTAAICLAIAALFCHKRPENPRFYAREGFVTVALCWIVLAVTGALPFLFSGEIPSVVDALFETISGFTTTGSTIVTDVEALSHAALLWRSLTHWVGGMGVLVFMLIILPLAGGHTIYLMRAESPGPSVSKMSPHIRDTAFILYAIYFGMTVLQIILLVLGGMAFFDAVCTSMATAGTGGFGIWNNSMAHYDSYYLQGVTSIFMMLFGVNFSIYFLLLMRKFKDALTDSEFLGYFGIAIGASVLIALDIIDEYGGFWNALRYSFFQVSSLMTTTGFATADFTLWPAFSKSILVLVMIIGAWAGSTGGGLKVSRVIIFFKAWVQEIGRQLSPRRTSNVRVNGRTLPAATLHNTLVFIGLYFLLTSVITAVVSLDGYDLETTLASVISCMSNVGPGLGPAGPMGNFDIFSDLSKVLLSFAMLAGRLEIFPMLILFAPATWRRR